MTAISTKSSVLAIKPEVTEGTPVGPSSGSDFTAIQDDFTMAPGTETLENAERRASIGAAKPILGAESPTCSFSHYWRASGVAGTAPDFNELLKTFFGSEVVASTEYDTTSGSTTTAIKFPGGEGVNFQRGQFLLIKDPTNGYRVRSIYSMSTDDANLLFSVPNAPASGVNTGKCVLWKPANSGHQTLTLWNYIGNGGAREVVAGARVTGMTISATAGQLINANYTLEGSNYLFNPIEITSSTRYLDWTDDTDTFAVALTAKWYKTPHDVAAALQSAMRAANPLKVATVTYSDTTGKFTIKTTGTLLSLLWNTGTNNANGIGTKLGFLVASDDTGTGATTGYSSDNAQTLAAPYTPSYDSADALAAKNQEVMFGDQDDYACFEASSVTINGTNAIRAIQSICAETGKKGTIISGRTVSVDIVALLDQYDVDKYQKYKEGDQVRFQYTAGKKSGGNWIEGQVIAAAIPTGTITAFSITDDDGLATLNCTIDAYVDESGNGEFYCGTV